MKMHNIKWLLLALFLFLSNVSFAEIINKVVISGNSSTKERQIIRWGGIRLGKTISREDLEMVIERLRRAYQFNLLSVKLVDDTLYLEIEEKWSLFPVPMISQSGNYYSRGILLYENNFLGRLGTFAPGVFWTNSGLNGIVYFQEDNIITTNVGMKVILLHKSDLTEFERKDKVLESFETRIDSIVLTPNYLDGRNDHKFGPIYMKKEVYQTSPGPVFHSERFGLYYRHHYNRFVKLPVLFDGFETTYDLFFLPDWKGSNDFLNGGDIQYCKPHGNNFFKSEVHFHYTNNKGYLAPKTLGGNEGHRGYDRESLPVQRNLGFMLQEQLNITDRVYWAPFYEFNYSKLINPLLNGDSFSESTVGFNFSYYFRTISIPAVILEFARNIDDQSYHLHMNVGLKL